jgi:uncharacterized protein (TIGR00725 family)
MRQNHRNTEGVYDMMLPIIGIMGSGQEPWDAYAQPIAEWIAHQGFHLLTGGGNGVMAAASEAFFNTKPRTGLCIGVAPTIADDEQGFVLKQGYPNPWVELCIQSPLSTFDGTDPNAVTRNHINILTSHVIIALPGSKGTRNEVELALRFKKPIIVYAPENMWASYPTAVQKTDDISVVQQFVNTTLAS